MAGPARHPRRRIALLLFSGALFAAILWFGGADSWRVVLSGDPRLYLAAFVLSGLAPALSAWRLQTLVRATTGGPVPSLRRFFHINMTAISLGLVLPRNAALLGGKAAYLRTLGVPLVRGTSAVLTENAVDFLFLAVIVVPAALVLAGVLGPGGFLLTNGALMAALVLVALVSRGRNWRGAAAALLRRVPGLAKRFPAPEGGFVPGPVRAMGMLATTVAIHATLALRAYLIALAIGLDDPWLAYAVAYPLTQLGLAVAVAPGALGTLDASWLGLLILLGLTDEDALAFTMAMRACIVVFPIIWYGVSALLSLSAATDAPQEAG